MIDVDAAPSSTLSARAACMRVLAVAVPLAMAVGALFVIPVAMAFGVQGATKPTLVAAGLLAMYGAIQLLVGLAVRRMRRAA